MFTSKSNLFLPLTQVPQREPGEILPTPESDHRRVYGICLIIWASGIIWQESKTPGVPWKIPQAPSDR